MARLILTRKEELDLIIKSVHWFNRPSYDEVNLELTLKDDHNDSTFYNKQIKNLFNDCGCGAGFISVVIATIVFIFSWDFGMRSLILDILIGIFIVFFIGVLGKFAGLGYSYFKLKSLLKRISRSVHE